MNELLLLPRPRVLERSGERGPPPVAEARETRVRDLPREGYLLRIGAAGVELAHADENGRRYGLGTLEQIRAQSDERLPALVVRDAPEFPVRGYLLDISRDRVPTRETLARIVELLGLLRLNHLELYTEHTFAYREHETVWRDASPLTPEDVRWLDALCREQGVELCANQNCFGHMQRWLRHGRYRHLAETPDGWQSQAFGNLAPSVLAPCEESFQFVMGLLRELLANFTSRRVHIGCDETFELGQGRSRSAVEARGRGRVYLEFLSRILDALRSEGFEALFWGDILRSHPELVPELPRRGATALVWHYEAPREAASLPRSLRERLAEVGGVESIASGLAAQVQPFAASGFPFWVCPGTSTWNSLVGRWPNARANLLDAAEVGLGSGAQGLLITDWGDNGHLQPPSSSFLPLAYGAALAWCPQANRALEMAPLLDRFVFEDAAGKLGEALELLGSVYAKTGLQALNASPLQRALGAVRGLPVWGEARSCGVRRVLDDLAAAAVGIERSLPSCSDGEVVKRELAQALRLARHGTWRIAREAGFAAPDDGELRSDLGEAISEQRACWLLRSRPGGLDQSVAALERTLEGYSS